MEDAPFSAVRNHGASFRDPSGFIFYGSDGALLRQVNHSYSDDYRHLMDSGLYSELVSTGKLIAHDEVPLSEAQSDEACCVLRPRRLRMISYAYEWCFSALKDAALLTLDVQRRALDSEMTLKDASHFNIQFDGVTPILIDTLSFERYQPGKPWAAYGQFCRHFLAPLALMSKVDVSLSKLLMLHLDGVPLKLASQLLPTRSKLSPGVLMHLHLHARFVDRYSDTSRSAQAMKKEHRVSRNGLLALIGSLRKLIEALRWSPAGTEWADYYKSHSYTEDGFAEKQTAIKQLLTSLRPTTVCDFGANTAHFTRIALDAGAEHAYAFDIDPACVENCYLDCRRDGNNRLLPLLLDFTNPTPAIGWANRERDAIFRRTSADVSLALALVHHLAISNNVPLIAVAEVFAQLSKYLIIEFVPKGDTQVKRLLQSRPDIFAEYHQPGFESAFGAYFEIKQRLPVGKDGRVLYLMARRPSQ